VRDAVMVRGKEDDQAICSFEEGLLYLGSHAAQNWVRR
jgi:hypothetical protein